MTRTSFIKKKAYPKEGTRVRIPGVYHITTWYGAVGHRGAWERGAIADKILCPLRKLGVLSQRTAGRPAPLSRAPCRPRGLQPAPITLNNVTSYV